MPPPESPRWGSAPRTAGILRHLLEVYDDVVYRAVRDAGAVVERAAAGLDRGADRVFVKGLPAPGFGRDRIGVSVNGPPDRIGYSLDEALDLLSDLELIRDTVRDTDLWSVRAAVESQVQRLARKLGLDEERSRCRLRC